MYYRLNIFKCIAISIFKYDMYIFFLLVFTCWIKWLFRNFNLSEKIIFRGDFLKFTQTPVVNKVILIFPDAASKAA